MMIVNIFSFIFLSISVTNSLPFEGYGILLVDLYEQPFTDQQETQFDVTFNNLEDQIDPNPKEIAINVGDTEMESLAEMVDILSLISDGFNKPMIGIEMQLYRMDNGFRQDLVSVNMIIDPSDEEYDKQYEEIRDESEKRDSGESVEEFFVDMHHTYSPYDRLINSYYGASSAKFLPMNLYRSYLAQSQPKPNAFAYDPEKQSTDYWNMMLNQDNLKAPSHYPSDHTLNTDKATFPTLEDALRMYDMEMKKPRSSEDSDDSSEEPSENLLITELDVDVEDNGVFSSFGNFFGRIGRVLF